MDALAHLRADRLTVTRLRGHCRPTHICPRGALDGARLGNRFRFPASDLATPFALNRLTPYVLASELGGASEREFPIGKILGHHKLVVGAPDATKVGRVAVAKLMATGVVVDHPTDKVE